MHRPRRVFRRPGFGDTAMKNERFMRRAFQLAKKGKGMVSPNPLVGAVVVREGKIIGEGYHRRAGAEHAEVVAIRQARHATKGATMYVNLEPCCHYGKTPPCTDSIIKAGISEIYIGTKDTNPIVSGKGIAQLKRHGITVHDGILRNEARQLNEFYFSYMEKRRPFIILKIAQTLDGKIADKTGNSKWITTEAARKRVHSLRNDVDAVLTGIGTVLADDPQLTPRLVKAKKQPLRIVLDSRLRIPLDAALARPGTIVATLASEKPRKKEKLQAKGVVLWQCKGKDHIPLKQVLRRAYQEKVQSILIEAGGHVASSFLKQHLVDKLYVFIGNKILGKGLSPFECLQDLTLARAIPLEHPVVTQIEGTILLQAYVYGNH
jgi:diaminohydroxyphosphoribosylaminopyrimidine deaminase/5-amino-6-(5-phosphoribosylamino)uracil reductase